MIKAVIFDMDGVLIDSVEIGLRTRKEILAEYGVGLDAIPDPQGEGHRAASTKSLLDNVESHHGVRIAHDEFARRAREHMYENLKAHAGSADPDLIAFLEELRSHDIVCAIASSGLGKGVDTKLEILGIKQYFSVITTGDDVTEHKPSPEPYRFTMEKLSVRPDECVIFEDSLTGIQAGRTAGCQVVGVAKYSPSGEPLPDVVATIHGWHEISYDKLETLLGGALI